MFEFGVRVCGGRSSPGGTVRADVTPPCLESGGEDRPSYVRGGGGAAAESEVQPWPQSSSEDAGQVQPAGGGCGRYSNTGGPQFLGLAGQAHGGDGIQDAGRLTRGPGTPCFLFPILLLVN